MDIHSISEAFESKVRIAILSALLTGEKNFNEIKELLKVTDGNLSTHLSKLEAMKYITFKKEFIGRKPKTTYKITEMGRMNFIEYVRLLEKMILEITD
jgi:Predicted transcriptional regulators